MQILIVGITGRIGKRVARLALESGHDIVGINRRPNRVPVIWQGQPTFPTHAIDALDASALGDLVAQTQPDAVVFATTPTREAPSEFLQQNYNLIAAVAAAAPTARLIALSGTYALNAPDGRPMLQASPPNPYFLELESVFSKQVEQYQAEAAGLDWLLIAPAAETFPYGEATGRYRVAERTLVVTDPASTSFKETSIVSMEDVAHLVVAEIEHPTHRQTLVSLAY